MVAFLKKHLLVFLQQYNSNTLAQNVKDNTRAILHENRFKGCGILLSQKEFIIVLPLLGNQPTSRSTTIE
ncbi:unnamed protein product [Ceratitis capitata]|uniref:(Mediterranean fruit fly) hypothetical protein n=1 Tax=Ceratitis capitata TaxID=7213 RepID=A0A811UGG2_CERCA|nr:unnamed protein product [Ceratitis capitata]